MAAVLDLALALVENDLGQETARSVARKLIVYHRRAEGQSQFSSLLELEPKSDRIRTALVYARENLHKPLSVSDLAKEALLNASFANASQAVQRGGIFDNIGYQSYENHEQLKAKLASLPEHNLQAMPGVIYPLAQRSGEPKEPS